jgi:hypothetical protein
MLGQGSLENKCETSVKCESLSVNISELKEVHQKAVIYILNLDKCVYFFGVFIDYRLHKL